MKKAGTRVVGWSPLVGVARWEMGWDIHTSPFPHLASAAGGHNPQLTPLRHPISPHIDEDALEGVYFAF